ncbi:MAG: 5'/3'-nucleotidase SurE [Anaerolineae bacterium]|nr:5'/3'-nucleotidase SurE [Anaerolineae bacterium]
MVTNDDGILSPGLVAAAEAVAPLGELLIVAPRYQQTAMGQAFPKGDDVGIIEEFKLAVNDKMVTGYGVHGSPAQAVSHAILELAEKKPELCVSGINYGENVGLTLMVSGTVGAAFEATTYDIPAIAISQVVAPELYHAAEYPLVNWDAAGHFTRHFAERVLKEKLPSEIAVLNVNVPASATTESAIRLTTQGQQKYFILRKPSKRDFSLGYDLELDPAIDTDKMEESSDIKAVLVDKVVSVTPLAWNLTAKTKWGREYDG